MEIIAPHALSPTSFAEIFKDIPFDISQGTCVTIGNFDGVHAGHRRLIGRTVDKARALGLRAVAITFKPHPLQLFMGTQAPPLITDYAHKLELLAETGLDTVVELDFTRELAALTPESFVHTFLVEGLNVRELVIGYDFSLGKGRVGNEEMLRALGVQYGFGLERHEPVIVNDAVVSSTRVRDVLRAGDVWSAKPLLERFHDVSGTVVHGMGRGSKMLGFATANIDQNDEQLPSVGVYATWVTIHGQRKLGVTNIGHNPTFNNEHLSIETHILDFDEDIYGDPIKVAFVQRLRSEKRFNGIDELVSQITQDVHLARELLALPEAQG